MRSLALVVGVAIVLFGITGVVAPSTLAGLAQRSVTPLGLYVVAAVRVGIGLVFLLAASESRTPRVVRLFGIVAVVAGLTTPFVGVERARGILNWWSLQGPAVIRLSAAVALALGGFVMYAFSGARRRA